MDESKQCIAMSKRTGQRCGLARIPGTTVCAKHGGAAPQVRAAAGRRVAEQRVRKAAMKLEVDAQEVSTDPVALLSGMIRSGAIMMERFRSGPNSPPSAPSGSRWAGTWSCG
jgi:hypothetical protein